MSVILYIVRGLSGSGKTTVAHRLAATSLENGGQVFSADDFFMESDRYAFDLSKLGEAHEDCQTRVREALINEAEAQHHWRIAIVVANTFSTRWEMEPYLNMAKELNIQVNVLDLYDGGLSDSELAERNVHEVPINIIAKMRERWEHNWKDADPRPPWKRWIPKTGEEKNDTTADS
jgi:predicted kinase